MTSGSAWISLDLPPGILAWVPGEMTDHHITVAYLGRDLDDEAFGRVLRRAAAAVHAVGGPLTGYVGGDLRTFEPSAGSDGKTVAYTSVDTPGLASLRESLADLDGSGRPDYVPHVTLRLLGPGDAMPPAPPRTEVTFTRLSVHRRGQGETALVHIPFPTEPKVGV